MGRSGSGGILKLKELDGAAGPKRRGKKGEIAKGVFVIGLMQNTYPAKYVGKVFLL
jgi:hypothetical protein